MNDKTKCIIFNIEPKIKSSPSYVSNERSFLIGLSMQINYFLFQSLRKWESLLASSDNREMIHSYVCNPIMIIFHQNNDHTLMIVNRAVELFSLLNDHILILKKIPVNISPCVKPYQWEWHNSPFAFIFDFILYFSNQHRQLRLFLLLQFGWPILCRAFIFKI